MICGKGAFKVKITYMKLVIVIICVACIIASCTSNEKVTESEIEETNSNQTDKLPIEQSTLPDHLKQLSANWETNWNKHNVHFEEFLSGGPPRDGIPSIDAPEFISIQEAQSWLKESEPVISLEINGNARAYPLQILMWHEIVNDSIDGKPVLITFCPLCNAVITFDRRINDQIYEFGTSDLLRNSDLVMYDRTESL
jgi:hypothetical protein